MSTTSGTIYDTVKALRDTIAENAIQLATLRSQLALSEARGLEAMASNEALIRERESLIATKHEQLARREAERDAALAQVAALRDALTTLSDQWAHGHLWAGENRGDVIRGVERIARTALANTTAAKGVKP